MSSAEINGVMEKEERKDSHVLRWSFDTDRTFRGGKLAKSGLPKDHRMTSS